MLSIAKNLDSWILHESFLASIFDAILLDIRSKIISTLSYGLTTFYILGRNMLIDYRVLQTIQMKLILLCVWAEVVVLGSTYVNLSKIQIWNVNRPNTHTIQCMGQDISLKSEKKNPCFKPWFHIFCTHNQLCVPQYM